ncbi:MAG: hypothetical protein IT454_02215 [Planctomycetes bacterium]|nr:hypothetical protein [Planctomycetota bacterium]
MSQRIELRQERPLPGARNSKRVARTKLALRVFVPLCVLAAVAALPAPSLLARAELQANLTQLQQDIDHLRFNHERAGEWTAQDEENQVRAARDLLRWLGSQTPVLALRRSLLANASELGVQMHELGIRGDRLGLRTASSGVDAVLGEVVANNATGEPQIEFEFDEIALAGEGKLPNVLLFLGLLSRGNSPLSLESLELTVDHGAVDFRASLRRWHRPQPSPESAR